MPLKKNSVPFFELSFFNKKAQNNEKQRKKESIKARNNRSAK